MSAIKSTSTWLVQRRDWVFLGIAVTAAVFMRFWQFNALPPGLTTAESVIGLQAQELLSHGKIPLFDAANGYAPLFTWLQAAAIFVFGHHAWSLRIWPAILGIGAVIACWFWARSWFNARIAGIAAFVLAVTPWAVMISRNGTPTSLAPLLATLTLLLAGLAYIEDSAGRRTALVAALLLCVLSGPLGWVIGGAVCLIGLIFSLKRQPFSTRLGLKQLIFIIPVAIIASAIGFTIYASFKELSGVFNAAAFISSLSDFFNNTLRTLLMFNLQGDESFAHNLGGQPLLNIFTGIMLVAGILTGISRFGKNSYRVLFALLGLLLLPALFSNAGVPNAAHAAAVMPIIMVFVGIGVSYMLELWYGTFPVNSAARSLGQASIIVLLGLTFIQGYTQIFNAWAGTAEAHLIYNESAVAGSKFIQKSSFKGQIYFVGSPSELPVATFLVNDKPPFTALTPTALTVMPLGAGARQFVVAFGSGKAAQTALAAKFPGGLWKPYLSDFSGYELFYVYEVTK